MKIRPRQKMPRQIMQQLFSIHLAVSVPDSASPILTRLADRNLNQGEELRC